jgi:hypothetical protein
MARKPSPDEARRVMPEHYVSVQCDCGKKVGAYLKHYALMRCVCGFIWWALQPKADGPLKLFPWPGPNLTAQELEEREKAEAA